MRVVTCYDFSNNQHRHQGLAFSQLTGKWARLLPLSYAAYSGMLGALCVHQYVL